jgi:hypothetical protein
MILAAGLKKTCGAASIAANSDAASTKSASSYSIIVHFD